MASIIGGLLPNGKQQFFDPATGAPAAGGFVYMYAVGTTTAKNTYQDSALATLNANPVPLDGYGMATIWGVGQYRQILQNASSVQIWDQVVGNNSLALNAPDTGTANAYAATLGGVPSLALIQGVPIYLSVANTNTGASTFNLNGLGAVALLNGTGGTLASGAVVAGSIIPVIYNGTAFQIVGAVVVSLGGSVPIGAQFAFAGSSIGAPYYLCYGQAVSRTTYALLFSVIGTAYGIGDGSTTFNLPDKRGRASFGADAMGGTAAGRLTSVSLGGTVSATVGVSGGNENIQYHGHTVTITDPGHLHTAFLPDGASGSYSGGASSAPTTQPTSTAFTGITAAADAYGGGDTQNLPPAQVDNWIIYAGV